MPLLSKAKLLNTFGSRTGNVKEFVYRGVQAESPSDGPDMRNLPVATEMLWEEPVAHEDQPEAPAKKFTEEELKARENEARQKGFQEAARRAREDLEKALDAERVALAAALHEFTVAREAHYQKVEGEVVRLVLAIARKVLHREAQVDPMLMTGVVRVALEKISNNTTVKLRVPIHQLENWRETIRSFPGRESTIEVVGDASLAGPRCLIVTEMGTTDVSLESQLAEIERGFLDLLSQRPGEGSRELHPPS